MTGLRPKVAAIALVLAGLATPAGSAGPSPEAAAALTERSRAMNRLVRERPELFEAIGAAHAAAEARQDAILAYSRRDIGLRPIRGNAPLCPKPRAGLRPAVGGRGRPSRPLCPYCSATCGLR